MKLVRSRLSDPVYNSAGRWHWPLGMRLVGEFSYQRTTYEENSRRIEIRPILEKSFGRLQIDLSPVFERAIHGPGTRDGWSFEPAVRLAYKAKDRFTPSIELDTFPGQSEGGFVLSSGVEFARSTLAGRRSLGFASSQRKFCPLDSAHGP
jgi:hypothetical protein